MPISTVPDDEKKSPEESGDDSPTAMEAWREDWRTVGETDLVSPASYVDSESEFLSEEPGTRTGAPTKNTLRDSRKARFGGAQWLTIGLAVLAIGQAGLIAAILSGRWSPTALNSPSIPAPSTPLLVESPESGADVLVDGRKVGVTPMTLDVTAATKSIRVVAPTTSNAAPAALPVASAISGQLQITSDPVGARVTVDGARRGVTPITLAVSPGQHAVQIDDGTSTSTRSVHVAAGATATLMSSFAPAGSGAGWLTLATPLEVQVTEAGTLLGTSAARLMLPAGHHDLELANTAVGFRTTLSVDVQSNKTVTTNVTVPNGSVSINALPWANVFLDGRPLGSTPIANLEVPLGTHEIVWRHPQLAERQQTIVVTARSPVRVVMDLTK